MNDTVVPEGVTIEIPKRGPVPSMEGRGAELMESEELERVPLVDVMDWDPTTPAAYV